MVHVEPDDSGTETNSYHPNDWDNTFYATDCTQSNVSIFGATNYSKLIIYSTYLMFVLFTGYIYGRHKGLLQNNDPSNGMEGTFSGFSFAYLRNIKYIKTKVFDFLSKIWFILSTFVFPWYLCVIWLFYVIHFNDINYVNSYNPWIIPFIVIYCLYSVTVITSYSYYCDFKRDKCGPLMIRSSIIFAGCYGMFMFYVLIIHRSSLNDWKIDGFSGNKILHCFDFDIHKNPTLFLVLFMIYCLITHHIFVILRAITAKLCYNHYISKKRKRFEKRSKSRSKSKSKRKSMGIYERRCVIDPRGGIRAPAYIGNDNDKYKNSYTSDDGMDEFDIDEFDQNDNRTDSELDDNDDGCYDNDNSDDMNGEYIRKPSNSKSKHEQYVHGGYRINVTPEPNYEHAAMASAPPEFNLVSSVDPSVLKMSCLASVDDASSSQATPSGVPPVAFQYV